MAQDRDYGPQFFLAFIVNIVGLTYGVMVGWMAPMQPLLQGNYTGTNETSPFGKDATPLTNEEFSWIGGWFCVGGIISTPLYGYLANTVGRRMTIVAGTVPFIFSFGMFLMATNVYYIYISRFIAGLASGGIWVVIPMYIGEISEPSIRGVLGSFQILFTCLGILASFVVGAYTSYTTLGTFALIWPCLFLVCLPFVPESPVYLLMRDRVDEARSTLTRLRGGHKEIVEKELIELTASVKEMSTNRAMTFCEMWRDPPTCKGLLICVLVMCVLQLSGIAPILGYTVFIFEASGSQLSPNIATIIVGALQLFGSLFALFFIDKVGRKFLLIFSTITSGLSLVPIAVFFYLKRDYDEEFLASIGWVPVVSLAVYIVVFVFGIGSVPFVLIGELFKAEARGKAVAFAITTVWFMAFVMLKFFPSVQDWIGCDSCFTVFALSCFLGAVIMYYYIPETKGKTLEQTLEVLGEKKPQITSIVCDKRFELPQKPFEHHETTEKKA